MERNFTNENLEQFLKQNAEGLRMLPSEKVWKGISKHFLQRRRKWGLFIGVSLLITTTAAYYIINPQQDSASVSARAIPGEPVINDIVQNSATNDDLLSDNVNSNLQTFKSKPEARLEFSPLIITSSPQQAAGTDDNETAVSGMPSSITGDNTGEGDNDTEKETVNEFVSTIVDDTYPLTEPEQKKITAAPQLATDPLSIESVMNLYSASRRKKVQMQIHFTPTVSYRKLSENKAYLKTVSPSNIPSTQQSLYDINNFVTHKPDFGFELGLTAKYPATKDLKLTAGLQFNVNRYDIKVFNSSTQLATIRLNNRNGRDSVNRATNYSNTPNGHSNWLENFYFQVSAPIGVEFRIKGDDRVEFGIASTVQPTYVLGDRAYLISTDYKNYAEVPWLIRRWNVNTSLETFVQYSTGKLNWQVGPQVRYQLLSSFVKKYPVKENLFDFGLKVGIGLHKQ